MLNCWRCPSDGYLRALAEACGQPGHAGNLKSNPFRYLGPPLEEGKGAKGPPAPLPTPEDVAEWRRGLRKSRQACRYLTRQRGIPLDVADRHGLGYDGEAITIPVYDRSGPIVNLRRRFLQGEPKIVGLKGRGSQLYPDVPRPRRTVYLCEGEFDALVGRAHGLPTVTTTCGHSLGQLAGALRPAGRRIAIIYDAGSEEQAEVTRRQLAEMGARAWVVSLPGPEGYDLTDWFCDGRSTAELRRLGGRARRAE